MKPTSRKSCLSHADTYNQSGLFGENQFTPSDSGAGFGSDARFEKSRSYWIKKSAEQTIDKVGEPAGFQYQSMVGSKILESGTDGSARSKFLTLATLLNSKQSRPNP